MNPTRLNLGCGPHAIPGWVNVDRSPNMFLDRVRPLKRALRRAGVLSDVHMVEWSREILMHDLRKPLPYADGTVDAIYSSHALEHLYLSDATALLRDCHRVLRAGAHLRLALPDAEAIAASTLGEAPDGLAFNRQLNSHPLVRETGLAKLRSLLGASQHRWQPTEDLVARLLAESGFVDIRRCTFRDGDMDDLDVIELREESLFLEATA